MCAYTHMQKDAIRAHIFLTHTFTGTTQVQGGSGAQPPAPGGLLQGPDWSLLFNLSLLEPDASQGPFLSSRIPCVGSEGPGHAWAPK